ADDAATVGLLHLAGLVGLDHAVLLRHPPDPAVALDAHARFPAADAARSGHCRALAAPQEPNRGAAGSGGGPRRQRPATAAMRKCRAARAGASPVPRPAAARSRDTRRPQWSPAPT